MPVAEALAPAAGGITGGYGLMWLVMIVPALGTLAIALGMTAAKRNPGSVWAQESAT